MALCAQCGLTNLGADEICLHHLVARDADWAVGNRIMCDFLHRGIVPATPREWREDVELLIAA